MGPTFRGKIVLSIVGLLMAVSLVLFFPWWLAILGLAAMAPFFFRSMTL